MSFGAAPRHCLGSPNSCRKARQSEAETPLSVITPPQYPDRAFAIFRGSVRRCPPRSLNTQRRRRFCSSQTSQLISAFRRDFGEESDERASFRDSRTCMPVLFCCSL